MFKIGITRQISKAELSVWSVPADETLLFSIEVIVLRYSMMHPAPFPDWYGKRLEKVIDCLQVEITKSSDHRSLLIAAFIALDDEYVPMNAQLSEESAAANARDYADTLKERYDTHIRKMIKNTSYEQYSNAIKQALDSNSDIVRKVKIERAEDIKQAQCCGLCAHYKKGGYACKANGTPLTFPLYPTDGKICGQFKINETWMLN